MWDDLHPTMAQQRELYDWLVAHGEGVLTGDSFFHLSAFGDALPGLNLCGAGRVVCLIDPVGDVYACPFAIHDAFLAGNVAARAASARSGASPRCSPSCASRSPAARARPARHYDTCQGGCMAAKFFTGLPLDGPDPECVQGYGELALAAVGAGVPKPTGDHSHSPASAAACAPGAARSR